MPNPGLIATIAALELKESERDTQEYQDAERVAWIALDRYHVDPGTVREIIANLILAGRIIGERQARARDLKLYLKAVDHLAERCAKVNQDGNIRALGIDKTC